MQFFIFLICLCCGVVSGVFYDVLYIARSLIFLRASRRSSAKTDKVAKMNKAAKSVKAAKTDKAEDTVKAAETVAAAVCDLLTFAFLSALYVLASVLFDFPDARFYMFLACFCGFLLYIKSFHILVAFLKKKLYNRFTAGNE